MLFHNVVAAAVVVPAVNGARHLKVWALFVDECLHGAANIAWLKLVNLSVWIRFVVPLAPGADTYR